MQKTQDKNKFLTRSGDRPYSASSSSLNKTGPVPSLGKSLGKRKRGYEERNKKIEWEDRRGGKID